MPGDHVAGHEGDDGERAGWRARFGCRAARTSLTRVEIGTPHSRRRDPGDPGRIPVTGEFLHAQVRRAQEQEKSLSAWAVVHWVTVTVPLPVKGFEPQFFSACESVLAPGIQSGR